MPPPGSHTLELDWLLKDVTVNDQPTISSGASNRIRFGRSFDPGRRRKQFDFGDLCCWQSCEQILQVIKRVDAVPTVTAEQGVDYRAAFPGCSPPVIRFPSRV